jgi:ribose transport system substrate-binding protein
VGVSALETHKRRQTILTLLRQSGSLDVDEVAVRLGVSPNTIRNDFNALAAEGSLQRVRGGAAALPDASNGDLATSNTAFQVRYALNQKAKENIARWAADLVEDGDSLVLDASTTAFHLADFLMGRHNLTIVTNGIEVGRKLAQNPSNTVMLLGGLLRGDGVPTGDVLSDPVLRDLHVKTAFVSCAGFTPETGLTETDILDSQLKGKMIAAAGSVVALIDASKFGKVGLAPFARIDQVSHIFTDSSLAPEWIEQLRRSCIPLTVCDENSIAAFAPCDRESRSYKIGFANLTERMPFALQVRLGLEQAAAARKNVDLLIRDNDLDRRRALENVDWFIGRGVDLVIEYQIDAEAGNIIMDRFRQANIPVIAVDIPLPGAIFFGADNYRAGYLAGEGLGRWIQKHWGGSFDRLLGLVDARAGVTPAARLHGGHDGLEAVLGPIPSDRVMTLPCPTLMHEAEAMMCKQLAILPGAERIAILAPNDDAALGALAAFEAAGRLDRVAAVGQNADRLGRAALQRTGFPFVGSTSYAPETYGQRVIDLALKILQGEPVPPAVYIEHTFVSA